MVKTHEGNTQYNKDTMCYKVLFSMCFKQRVAFVSGQLPVNPEGNSIPEGVTEQTKQSLRNIKSILESSLSKNESPTIIKHDFILL